MTCFGMVTTARSSRYTLPALESFFRHTEMAAADRFLLIDNDGGFAAPARFSRVELVANARPLGFAANVNQVIAAANQAQTDVVMLNNDIVFTAGWLAPLRGAEDAILVPLCNQQQVYRHGALALQPLMDLEQVQGHEADLDAIVAAHRANPEWRGLRHAVHISFFCFRLPRAVHQAVGAFDEGFGRGGGEDLDYRIRAHLAGFHVGIAVESYVLHFMGKSTWRGGESADESRAREAGYIARLRAKWGEDLAQMFLFSGNWQAVVARIGLQAELGAGDFPQIVRRCLARRNRD
jgi:GT2 family glycosyltransferase